MTEATFVVVDGDLTDPAVANAILEAQGSVGDIAGVRTINDTPQVLSVLSLAAAVLEGSAQRPPVEGWTGEGFTDDADLGSVYDRLREAVGEQRLEQLLSPDAQAAVVQIRTTAGDAGAERLQREVEAAFAPVRDTGAGVTVTSEPIIIAEMSEDLSAFQAQAIGLTLVVVLTLLTVYYALARRRWLLGVIAMIPAVVGAALILGTMWLLGISFNVLTATLTAIAIGIGVPYGVHVVNRFAEDLADAPIDDVLKAAIGVRTEGYVHQSIFFYPRHGGFQAITDGLARALRARIRLSTPVRELVREGGGAGWRVNGEPFDLVVSTLPLDRLPDVVPDMPAPAAAAMRGLAFNSMVTYLVALDRPAHPDLSWIYLPHHEQGPVNRVTYMSNYSPALAPEGKTSFLFEVTFPGHEEPPGPETFGFGVETMSVSEANASARVMGRTRRRAASERQELEAFGASAHRLVDGRRWRSLRERLIERVELGGDDFGEGRIRRIAERFERGLAVAEDGGVAVDVVDEAGRHGGDRPLEAGSR